jgi:class 3 adenylate cyclase/tetratricopeptide (TPR) repeat protein
VSVAHEGQAPAPESYTPKHLAERILNSKAALEGERKQVTVLFADLKGSMELLADRDPEDARKLLDPVLELMMEAVHRYEGTVNQVMGDGIMALFGAPLAQEDHAVRACYAALRMQEAIKQHAAVVRRERGVMIRARVGMNSGEVVVRTIGSDLHMDYSAVGQTTHLAARMEQLADPGAILLTAATLMLAEGFIQVAPLGAVAVKGFPGPVDTYELTGISAARSRLEASATRGLSRFVGRDAEMNQLHRAVEQARQGKGQVVAVVGEPGVGKSRITLELTRSHRIANWRVLQAGSVPYGKTTSYLPVADLLRGYFAIDDRDTHRNIQEKVTGKLLAVDAAFQPLVPALLALLDVPVEDRQWQGLEPTQRRQRTLDAVKRLLLRETQVQPLLVILEDLHWLDGETQAILDGLIESLPTARMLLVVNYRPEYQHAWTGKTFYTQVRLDPLPEESAEALLDALIGRDSSLDPLRRLLVGKAEGIPLFIEESVRTLVEGQVLHGQRGDYRLRHTVDMVQVPATVQAILAARIDRLSAGAKRLLEIAAVVGKDVPLILLQVIAGENDEALREQLGHLQMAEFLYEARLFPDLEYTFKHALTHEVAYATVLQDRRRQLHGQIAEAIEAHYATRLGEHVERLAHHCLKGEVWEPAVRYLWQAGTKAMERSALREAVVRFEDALSALRHLPETRTTLENAFDIRLDLRLVMNQLGELARVLVILREAKALADTLGDNRRRGRVHLSMVNAHNLRSELDDAVASGGRALEIADASGDVGLRIATTTSLEQTHFYRGDYQQVVALATANLNAAAARPIDGLLRASAPPSVFDRHWLVRGLAQLGRFSEATEPADTMIRLADQMHSPIAQGLARFAAATVHMWKGNWRMARELNERAVRILQEGHQVLQLSYVVGPLAWMVAALEEPAEALSHAADAERRLELIRALGRKGGGAETCISLCQCYLLLGRLEDAERMVERIPEDRTAASQAQALRVQAEIAAHPDRWQPERVEECHRRALGLADKLGMRPLVAHCHLGLGKLYRRTDKDEQAREHLATATTMYREMGMTYWLEQAEAALLSRRP